MEYVVHIVHRPEVKWWVSGRLFQRDGLWSVEGGKWRGSECGEMEREVVQMGRKSLALPDQEYLGIKSVVFLYYQYQQRLT